MFWSHFRTVSMRHICCCPVLELSHRDSSKMGPQYMRHFQLETPALTLWRNLMWCLLHQNVLLSEVCDIKGTEFGDAGKDMFQIHKYKKIRAQLFKASLASQASSEVNSLSVLQLITTYTDIFC